MASTTSVDPSSVCRCCLQKKNDLINLFKAGGEENKLSYAALIKNCVGLQAHVGDGLPDQICSGCSKDIAKFFDFKKMCLMSDKLLRPAIVLLERLKEVACQTDEYHISLGLSTKNVLQIDSEESLNSIHKSLQELNNDNENTPNKSSIDVEKVIESTGKTDGDEEKVITDNLSKSSTLLAVPPFVKDISGKEVSSLDTSQVEKKDSTLGKDLVIKHPDLPLPDENIFTLLDTTEDKNAEAIQGSKLENVSSCNSPLPRDIIKDGPDVSKEKETSGSEITKLSNLPFKEKENANEVHSTADDVLISAKITDKNVSELTNSEKGKNAFDVGKKNQEEIIQSSNENESENISASVSCAKASTSLKYKINIKSIEDLTMEKPKIDETPKNSDITSTEIESALSLKEDLSLGSLLKTSVARGVEESVFSNEESFKNKTLDQVITMSLEKSVNKECKDGQAIQDSKGTSCQNADVNISSSSDARKRPRPNEADDDKTTVTEEKSLDPSKKPRVTESLPDDVGLSQDRSNDGCGDLNTQRIEKTIETKEDDLSNTVGDNVIKNVDEIAKQFSREDIGLEAADLEELGNLSDDGLFEDDDSVSNSSGSEYVPGDSPTRSDDSPRARRSAPKSKSCVKSHLTKFQEQGYNIRECSVVLSDIAHPSSNAFSTTCSVSSFKSSTNDSDTRKEPAEAVDQPSICTAWIKVEPGMENMEEEGVEENSSAEKTEDKEEPQDVLWPVEATETTASPQTQGISAEPQSAVAKFVSGRKRFLCPFCAKAFRTKNQMMLHRSQHTGDLPFPCEVCGKRFALRCRLLRHMSVHDASIVCEFCGMDFKTNILLGKHIKAKHTIPSYSHTPVVPPVPPPINKSGQKFTCKICPKVFSTLNGAKHTIPSYSHTQVVPPVPPPINKSGQRFPCRICPKVFSTLNGLKVHKRVHVNTPIKVLPPMKEEGPSEGSASENSCTICGMSFPNPLYLKSHMVCHTIIRPNSGQINSIESSKRSEKADDHQRTGGNADKNKIRDEPINVMEPTVVIHESSSSFGETSFQQQNQQYSNITHNICIVCSQIFQSRSQLLRHQTLIHRSLKCEICAAFFTSTDQLQEHKLTHEPPYDNVGSYKKIHKCTDCGKQFPKRARLLQHMAIHKTVETPVICEVCKKYFANVEILNIHKRIHENGQAVPVKNDLTCSVCHRVFGKRSRLKRHMLLHESQSFPCTKCTKTFISQELLAEHQVTHNAAPVEEVVEQGVTCTACGRMFSNKARLKQHVVVHTKSGFVSCYNCFKVFANKQVLDMHTQVCTSLDDSSTSVHSATSNSASVPHPSTFTSCSSCGKMFPSKELLTEHEKTCVGLTVVKKLDGTWKVLDNDDRSRVGAVSSSPNIKSEPSHEPRVYACKSCNKRFKNYHGLNSHMRFHQESVGIYKCELCNKKFSSRNKLSQHMSSHTAVYRCGICSQAFGMVDELKKHVGQCMASQSGMTANYFFCNGCSEVFNLLEELAQHVKCHADEFPHVCTECYKVFAHSTQLNRHLTTHVKEETSKYACPVCQKMFGHSAALDKHMVVHTGEKRFQCSYCLQRFSQKSSLKRHKLTQHETKS